MVAFMWLYVFMLQEIFMFILVKHCFRSMTTVAYRKIFKNRQIWNISYITSRNKNLDRKWLSLFFTTFHYRYPLSVGVRSVTAASTAVPPLAFTTATAFTFETSAAVAALCARDPARLSDSGRVVYTVGWRTGTMLLSLLLPVAPLPWTTRAPCARTRPAMSF